MPTLQSWILLAQNGDAAVPEQAASAFPYVFFAIMGACLVMIITGAIVDNMPEKETPGDDDTSSAADKRKAKLDAKANKKKSKYEKKQKKKKGKKGAEEKVASSEPPEKEVSVDFETDETEGEEGEEGEEDEPDEEIGAGDVPREEITMTESEGGDDVDFDFDSGDEKEGKA